MLNYLYSEKTLLIVGSSYLILFYIFISAPEIFLEWGRVRLNPEIPVREPECRWKVLSEWTFGDVLFSPVMLYTFIGVCIFGCIMYISVGLLWLLLMNKISKYLWLSFFKFLGTNIFKKQEA